MYIILAILHIRWMWNHRRRILLCGSPCLEPRLLWKDSRWGWSEFECNNSTGNEMEKVYFDHEPTIINQPKHYRHRSWFKPMENAYLILGELLIIPRMKLFRRSSIRHSTSISQPIVWCSLYVTIVRWTSLRGSSLSITTEIGSSSIEKGIGVLTLFIAAIG